MHSSWRKRNPEKFRIQKARGVARWRLRNREKYLAHKTVENAIRDGRLVRAERCADCGSETRLHGHHEDYRKPLEVIWVCSPCHRARHGG